MAKEKEKPNINYMTEAKPRAMAECVGCKNKRFKKCEKYKLFMKLDIPVAQEQTDGCPYEN